MAYECAVKSVAAQPTLSITGRTSVANLSTAIGEFLPEVWEYVTEQGSAIKAGMLPGGEVVSTVHVGPYHSLSDAGAALAAWAKAHGRAAAGPDWELYVTDPGVEPDPTQWKTEVVKPLAPRG